MLIVKLQDRTEAFHGETPAFRAPIGRDVEDLGPVEAPWGQAHWLAKFEAGAVVLVQVAPPDSENPWGKWECGVVVDNPGRVGSPEHSGLTDEEQDIADQVAARNSALRLSGQFVANLGVFSDFETELDRASKLEDFSRLIAGASPEEAQAISLRLRRIAWAGPRQQEAQVLVRRADDIADTLPRLPRFGGGIHGDHGAVE